ncbi:MAG TPA: alpha/beta hydrolase [Ilumatobacteraceae bacterium]|nr:alpha/beta hydrolase [Ilumatobacteraceae bacterium]HRB04895.1 alpha/beta hydrolase [Ilumatobacteraceae bacterium]
MEREYSPSSRVGGDASPFVAEYRAGSRAARELLADRLTVLTDGTIVATEVPSLPLLVFIHGGYWQGLSASESLSLAPPALAQGWSYVAIEYTIAPTGNIPQMIRECEAALASLAGVVSPSTVVLVGHSAGAHLAAMVSLVSSSPLRIDRTVLLSGVFDLRPLLQTTVNDPLEMDEATAVALSPQLLPVAARHDVVVAWGDNETDAFKMQSQSYAAHLSASGLPVTSFECADRNHFDIVGDVTDLRTELGRLALGGL